MKKTTHRHYESTEGPVDIHNPLLTDEDRAALRGLKPGEEWSATLGDGPTWIRCVETADAAQPNTYPSEAVNALMNGGAFNDFTARDWRELCLAAADQLGANEREQEQIRALTYRYAPIDAEQKAELDAILSDMADDDT